MEWKIDKNRPISPQICEHICLLIARGVYEPFDRLPSVREIAVAAGVNPNTVQHSCQTLEQQGIIYSVRGSGWFVSEDNTLARDTLNQILRDKTAAYFEEMAALGQTPEDTKKFVEEWMV